MAYAIGRAYGPAVRRNRLRRRLREILREIDRREPLPPGILMIGVRPESTELTFDQLRREVRDLVSQLATSRP